MHGNAARHGSGSVIYIRGVITARIVANGALQFVYDAGRLDVSGVTRAELFVMINLEVVGDW